MAHDVSALMGLVALTFDRLTLKWYVSRIKGGEPSLRIRACYKPSGSPAIRYVRDGRTDKTNAYCPLFPRAGA